MPERSQESQMPSQMLTLADSKVMEYLSATLNGDGRPCVYNLARAEENGLAGLRGLTDVAEIRQRLKEKAAG